VALVSCIELTTTVGTMMMGTCGVHVAGGVAVSSGVALGIGVLVGVGVSVGIGVAVGVGVLVGCGVYVGAICVARSTLHVACAFAASSVACASMGGGGCMSMANRSASRIIAE
jgi:hypothetical protein